MDPYLENPDLWPDVHHGLIGTIKRLLSAKLRTSNYVARVELRTFMFDDDDPASEIYVIPDARVVLRNPEAIKVGDGRTSGGTAVIDQRISPAIDVTELSPAVAQERFIEIRDASNRQVVTVIELVSPSNKRAGSAGRRSFLKKRKDVTESNCSWLEIDLLRDGAPTISFPSIPSTAYRAYQDRTTADGRRRWLWSFGIREPLPVIGVPLRPGESDVPLDLQEALTLAFTDADYDLDTDYRVPPNPPLSNEDAQWASKLLRAKGVIT
ncbi:DUF4058 family protein [Humisphaera borealis]|uniref:DUF4058 family protein n=2 Tax=Humisphaera borealis TaxID=2807512 RepID=A0A7M2WRW5_9BACT|nr:DUF4058 family protein [Humisphaera borealis]